MTRESSSSLHPLRKRTQLIENRSGLVQNGVVGRTLGIALRAQRRVSSFISFEHMTEYSSNLMILLNDYFAGASSAYGNRNWCQGDIVGCLLDLGDEHDMHPLISMRFTLNGEDQGVAFQFGTELGDNGCSTLAPAVSLQAGEAMRVNFGALPFSHAPLQKTIRVNDTAANNHRTLRTLWRRVSDAAVNRQRSMCVFERVTPLGALMMTRARSERDEWNTERSSDAMRDVNSDASTIDASQWTLPILSRRVLASRLISLGFSTEWSHRAAQLSEKGASTSLAVAWIFDKATQESGDFIEHPSSARGLDELPPTAVDCARDAAAALPMKLREKATAAIHAFLATMYARTSVVHILRSAIGIGIGTSVSSVDSSTLTDIAARDVLSLNKILRYAQVLRRECNGSVPCLTPDVARVRAYSSVVRRALLHLLCQSSPEARQVRMELAERTIAACSAMRGGDQSGEEEEEAKEGIDGIDWNSWCIGLLIDVSRKSSDSAEDIAPFRARLFEPGVITTMIESVCRAYFESEIVKSALGENEKEAAIATGPCAASRMAGAPRRADLLRRCTALIQVVLDDVPTTTRLVAVLDAIGAEREQAMTLRCVEMHSAALMAWQQKSKESRSSSPIYAPLQPLATLLAMCWRVRRRALALCLQRPQRYISAQRSLCAEPPMPLSVEATARVASGTTVEVTWSSVVLGCDAVAAWRCVIAFVVEISAAAVVGAVDAVDAVSGARESKVMQKVMRRVVLGRAARRAVFTDLHPDANFTLRVTAVLLDDASETLTLVPSADALVSTSSEELFIFDAMNCGPNLSLSNGGLTATNTCDKQWNAVRSTQMFATGVHCWEVRVDRCVSKNIFIGVMDEVGCVGNYVGSDDHGWGFLANRAVWHSKAKTKSYGRLFRGGDVVGVRLDVEEGTLSFSLNGAPLGIAVEGLDIRTAVGGGFYPAFSLYNGNDSLSLLPLQLDSYGTYINTESEAALAEGRAYDALADVVDALDLLDAEKEKKKKTTRQMVTTPSSSPSRSLSLSRAPAPPPLTWKLQLALEQLWPIWSAGHLRSYPTATNSRGTYTASDGDDGIASASDLNNAVEPLAQRRLRLTDDIVLDVSVHEDSAYNPGARLCSGRKGSGASRPHDASVVGVAGGQVWLQIDGIRGLVPFSTKHFAPLSVAAPKSSSSAAAAAAASLNDLTTAALTTAAAANCTTSSSIGTSTAVILSESRPTSSDPTRPPSSDPAKGGSAADGPADSSEGPAAEGEAGPAAAGPAGPEETNVGSPSSLANDEDGSDESYSDFAWQHAWSRAMDSTLITTIESLGTASSPWLPSAESICKAVYDRSGGGSSSSSEAMMGSVDRGAALLSAATAGEYV